VATTDNTASQQQEEKEPLDLRLRKQYFPGADELVFDTRKKGFIPMPIIYTDADYYAQANAPPERPAASGLDLSSDAL
jgi:hypothetical protein